jgi:hypothetical protein
MIAPFFDRMLEPQAIRRGFLRHLTLPLRTFGRGGVTATGSLAGKVSFSASSKRKSRERRSSALSVGRGDSGRAARRLTIVRVLITPEYIESGPRTSFIDGLQLLETTEFA